MKTYRCYIPAYLPYEVEAKSKKQAAEKYGEYIDLVNEDITSELTICKPVPDIDTAEHPTRRVAIKIIDAIIEPLIGRGLQGDKYYQTEDKLVDLIDSKLTPKNYD